MNFFKDTQNRLFREVFKCAAILLVVVLLSSLLFTHFSFAFDSYSIIPISYSSSLPSSSSFSEEFTYGSLNLNGLRYQNIRLTSNVDFESYVVAVIDPNNSSNYEFYIVTDSVNSYSGNLYNGHVNGSSSSSNINFSNLIIDSSSNLKYYKFSSFSFYTGSSNRVSYVPIYSDLNTALSSVRNFIDNSFSSYDFESTIEIPAGSVAYIGVPSGGTLSMSGTTTFPINSTLFGSDKFPEASQRVSRTSSLPVSGTQFPLTPNSKPNWQRSEDGRNLFGQTRSAYFSSSDWSFDSAGFLTFYNPYYFNPVDSASTDQSSTLNSSVYLTISGYSSIRIYPLQDAYYTDGSISGNSPDGFDSYWDGEITDNGDGTGSVSFSGVGGAEGSQPSNNGYNQAPVQQSILKYIEDIRNTLSKFVNDVLSLLQAPISHISQLIEAGSGFMNGLRGLYSWLPLEVQSHLISALTLVIVIGVFKVFL